MFWRISWPAHYEWAFLSYIATQNVFTEHGKHGRY